MYLEIDNNSICNQTTICLHFYKIINNFDMFMKVQLKFTLEGNVAKFVDISTKLSNTTR